MNQSFKDKTIQIIRKKMQEYIDSDVLARKSTYEDLKSIVEQIEELKND